MIRPWQTGVPWQLESGLCGRGSGPDVAPGCGGPGVVPVPVTFPAPLPQASSLCGGFPWQKSGLRTNQAGGGQWELREHLLPAPSPPPPCLTLLLVKKLSKEVWDYGDLLCPLLQKPLTGLRATRGHTCQRPCSGGHPWTFAGCSPPQGPRPVFRKNSPNFPTHVCGSLGSYCF